MAVEIVQASSHPVNSSDSPSRKPRKPRTSDADLERQLQDIQRQIRQRRKDAREAAIKRLGTLAYKAGLDAYPDATLTALFADIAQRLQP